MSTFDEALHPRGSAGQFATKENSAPAAGLTPQEQADARIAELEATARAQGVAASAAGQSAYQWDRRARLASLNEFFANAAAYAPPGAKRAVFRPSEYDSAPGLSHFLDADGEELDDVEDFEANADGTLFGVDTDDDLKDVGFEWDSATYTYGIDLEEPKAPTRPLDPSITGVASTAHYIDDQAGGDGGLGDFLAAVARRNPDTAGALYGLSQKQVDTLARDFESFSSLMATKINGFRAENQES